MKVTYELEPGDLKYIMAPPSPCESCSAIITCGVYCTRCKEWEHRYGQEIQKRQLSEYHNKACCFKRLKEKYYLTLKDLEQTQKALQNFIEENKDFFEMCQPSLIKVTER